MKLYFSPGACSLAPHIVAHEAGLKMAYERVDLNTRTTASGRNFAKINPKGAVPTLSLPTGEVLTEVSVILEYLANQAPETWLMPPPGSLERYRVQEWVGFIGTELHKRFDLLWNGPMPEAARRLTIEQLQHHFTYLNASLKGHSYLMGTHFTVADAYCFTVLSWARFHRVDLSGYTAIKTFMHKVSGRPMVQRALQAEGLLSAA